MAWEKSTREGIDIMSGDKPIDEIAIALEKIVKGYENQFDRKPIFLEIMYALRIVIASNPGKYLSDPQNEKIKDILRHC